MKAKVIWQLLAVAGVILMTDASTAGQKEIAFYVAPKGDDSWSGMLPAPNKAKTDGPFATLQRAVEAIRELKRQQGGKLKQPVTVYLRGGTYFLGQPIVLMPEDSGNPQAPITFRAYRNEKDHQWRATNYWLEAENCQWQARVSCRIAGSPRRQMVFPTSQGKQ